MGRRPQDPTLEKKRTNRYATLKPIKVVEFLSKLKHNDADVYKSFNRHFMSHLPRYEAKRKTGTTMSTKDKDALFQLINLFDSVARAQNTPYTYLPFGVFSRLMLLEGATGESLRREYRTKEREHPNRYLKSKMPTNLEFVKYLEITSMVAKRILKEHKEKLGTTLKARRSVKQQPWEEGVPRNQQEFFSVTQYPTGKFHLPDRNVQLGFRFFTRESQRQDEDFFCSVCQCTMRYGDLFSIGKLYYRDENNNITLLKSPDYAHWECCCPQYDRLLDFQRNYLKRPLRDITGWNELDEETKSHYLNLRFAYASAGKKKKKKSSSTSGNDTYADDE